MSEKGKITQLKKLLKQIREKNIFQTIDDPVEWQRTIRDEWT
jgi:type II secretory ATPase GspE/PulE/Tfp pilus assembly ATPase PilB-like protein